MTTVKKRWGSALPGKIRSVKNYKEVEFTIGICFFNHGVVFVFLMVARSEQIEFK